MSCACCDEITTQMRQWRTEAKRLEVEVEKFKRWYEDEKLRRMERYQDLQHQWRVSSSLRGAFTKAKKRIAEMKEKT